MSLRTLLAVGAQRIAQGIAAHAGIGSWRNLTQGRIQAVLQRLTAKLPGLSRYDRGLARGLVESTLRSMLQGQRMTPGTPNAPSARDLPRHPGATGTGPTTYQYDVIVNVVKGTTGTPARSMVQIQSSTPLDHQGITDQVLQMITNQSVTWSAGSGLRGVPTALIDVQVVSAWSR